MGRFVWDEKQKKFVDTSSPEPTKTNTNASSNSSGSRFTYDEKTQQFVDSGATSPARATTFEEDYQARKAAAEAKKNNPSYIQMRQARQNSSVQQKEQQKAQLISDLYNSTILGQTNKTEGTPLIAARSDDSPALDRHGRRIGVENTTAQDALFNTALQMTLSERPGQRDARTMTDLQRAGATIGKTFTGTEKQWLGNQLAGIDALASNLGGVSTMTPKAQEEYWAPERENTRQAAWEYTNAVADGTDDLRIQNARKALEDAIADDWYLADEYNDSMLDYEDVGSMIADQLNNAASRIAKGDASITADNILDQIRGGNLQESVEKAFENDESFRESYESLINSGAEDLQYAKDVNHLGGFGDLMVDAASSTLSSAQSMLVSRIMLSGAIGKLTDLQNSIVGKLGAAGASKLALDGVGFLGDRIRDILGMTSFGVGAYGGYTNEARQALLDQGLEIGLDEAKKIRQYANKKTNIELATEMLFSSVGAIRNTSGNSIFPGFSDAFGDWFSSWSGTAKGSKILRTIGDKLGGGIEEGLEEVIGDVLDDFLGASKLIGDNEKTTFREGMKDFVVGFMSGMMGEVTSPAYSAASRQQLGNDVLSGNREVNYQQLYEMAQSMAEENPGDFLSRSFGGTNYETQPMVDAFRAVEANGKGATAQNAGRLYEAYQQYADNVERGEDAADKALQKAADGKHLTKADLNRVLQSDTALDVIAEATGQEITGETTNERRDSLRTTLEALASEMQASDRAQYENALETINRAANGEFELSTPDRLNLAMQENASMEADQILQNLANEMQSQSRIPQMNLNRNNILPNYQRGQTTGTAQNISSIEANLISRDNMARQNVAQLRDLTENMNLGENGRDFMLRNYNGTQDVTEYANAVDEAYELGRAGGEFSTDNITSTAIPYSVQRAAFNAGREDYLAGGTNNGKAETGLRLRAGSKRNDSQNTGESAGILEQSTGRNQSRQAGSFQREIRNARVSSESISAQTISGTGLRVVTDSSEPSVAAARKYAQDRGVNFVAWTGGSLTIDGVQSRGFYDPKTNTIYVRADHRMFTAEQIAKHETTHAMIHNGVINLGRVDGEEVTADLKTVYNALREELGTDRFEELLDKYVEMYAGTDLSRQDVFEEMICDAVAGMNEFEAHGHFEESLRQKASLTAAKAVTEENAANGTRAGPVGHGSRMSRDAEVPTVDLNGNTELEQLLNNRGEKSRAKVIREYLVSKYAGKTFTMSDGIKAIMDGGDAQKLSQFSGERGARQLGNLDSLIEKAVFDSINYEPDHPKFSLFRYYRVNARYGEETVKLRLNVGLGISDKTYHIYAINAVKEKEADTIGSVGGSPQSTGGSLTDRAASTGKIAETGSSVKQNIATEEKVNEKTEAVDVRFDANTESAAPEGSFSRDTWNESDYVKNRNVAAKELASALDVSQKKAEDYIDDINSIAKQIGDDATRLDYTSSPGRSSFVSNSEYGGSFDFSTLCKKRRLMTGTMSAIQDALPNTVLTPVDFLKIRNMMLDAGLEASCGLCYVEGSRAGMGQFTKEFLKLYEKYNPGKWVPTQAQMSTPDSIEDIRINHPEVYAEYEKFWNNHGKLRDSDPNLFASQQKPKLYQMRTAYDGEILKYFKKDSTIETKNRNGGVRLQSFSDFEIVHLIDTMQIIMDMSRVGLAGQAYTKVPDFALALGNTGLKINLSLITKGVDANGKLIFDDREGMNHETAFKIRDQYSKNVGTILVTFTDDQLKAAMADDRVDFIIPFHRSQWKKSQYGAMGLPANTKDYTYQQNEKWIDPAKHTHEYAGREVPTRVKNYMPNEWWQTNLSGKENAEYYLDMCAKDGKRPKFYKLLDYYDGRYHLKADGSTDGYWKLLIDFKMYDNDGNFSPQNPVRPDFNMQEANRMLNDYQGGHEKFPVARGIVDQFVGEYQKAHSGKLSRDPDSNDIRFSRDLSTSDLYDANVQLRKDLSELRQLLKTRTAQKEYWKGQTKVTQGRQIRQEDVTRLAKDLLKSQNSSADPEAVAAKLKALGEYILNFTEEQADTFYDDVRMKSYEIAHDILNEAKALKETGGEHFFPAFQDRLKSMTIYVPANIRNDISPEGWNELRSRVKGITKVTADPSKGMSIEDAYSTLQSEFDKEGSWLLPSYDFNGQANLADEFDQILRVVDEYAPVYENLNSYEMAEASEWMANEIMTRIVSNEIRETNPTYADKMEKKLADQKLKTQEALRKVREQRDRKVENLKEHYQEVAQARRDRKTDSEMRTRLLKIARRLNNKKLNRVTRDLLNQYIGDLDLVSKSITKTSVAKLEALEQWYKEWEDRQRQELGADFVPDSYIEKKLERLSKKQINDLTQEEVLDLTIALMNIETMIRTENELIDSQIRRDTYSAALDFIDDYQDSKAKTDKELTKALLSGVLSPERMAHRIAGYKDNDPVYRLTKELSDGQRKMFDYQRRAEALFEKWTNDKKFVDRIAGKNAKWITVKGLVDGQLRDVKITPAMRMSLYLHAKNEQNLKHIERGGVLIPNADLYKRGKMQDAYKAGIGTKAVFSRYMIHEITQQMSPEEKAFADMAYWYFNNMSKDAINEVSLMHKGYEIANVLNYFPIDTSRDFLKSDFGSIKQDGTVTGLGFLNERVEGATTPVMLYDMNNVLTKSIDGHSKYYGLAMPVRNLNKVLNVNLLNYEGSVRNNLLTEHTKYLDNMIRDVQTGAPGRSGLTQKMLSTFRSHYAGGVLALNAGVAVKQAASYTTAAAIIGYTPLAKALKESNRKIDIDLIAKYTPLLWYRSKGYSNAELGDIGKRGGVAAEMMNKKALNWIQGIDVWTTTKLWRAAEIYVQSNNKGLSYGTDAFYKEVAVVYNRIIEETQPNYAPMQRPGVLRSEDQFTRALNMFKTQPFQNANILIDAFGNMRAKARQAKVNPTAENQQALKDARRAAARAVTSQALSAFVFSLMQFVWDMARGKTKKYKDDEDEMNFWSVNRALLLNMLTSVGGMVPFGGTLLEFVESWTDKIAALFGSDPIFDQKWYGVSENSLDAINDFAEAVQSLSTDVIKAFQGGPSAETSARNIVNNLSTVLHTATGIPAPNIVKDFQTIALNALRVKAKIDGDEILGPGLRAEYNALRVTTDPAKYPGDYYNLLYKAYEKDRDAYTEILNNMLADPSDAFTEDKIRDAIETRMKKEQGVNKVGDLDQRWMLPDQQAAYDKGLADISGNKIWLQATDEQQQKIMDQLYDIAVGNANGQKLEDKIKAGADVGIDQTEFLLYQIALQQNDADGNGSYKQAEAEAAIQSMTGLTQEEQAYLFDMQFPTAKKNPFRVTRGGSVEDEINWAVLNREGGAHGRILHPTGVGSDLFTREGIGATKNGYGISQSGRQTEKQKQLEASVGGDFYRAFWDQFNTGDYETQTWGTSVLNDLVNSRQNDFMGSDKYQTSPGHEEAGDRFYGAIETLAVLAEESGDTQKAEEYNALMEAMNGMDEEQWAEWSKYLRDLGF